MTREEILNLKDHDLVEAVAEKCMGWTKIWKGEEFEGWKRNDRMWRFDMDWRPLHDENHLAEVREKMIERGFGFENHWGKIHKAWVVYFDEGCNAWKPTQVVGKSYAFTLLRAALLAVSDA